MRKNGVSVLKIAAAYIGTVVGAGFATGQEILQFFAGFGLSGLWGIILTTLLFIVFGFIIMELGFKLSARSHLEIIRQSGGNILGFVIDLIITFFLFGALTAMIAGTGALFHQQFGLPAIAGNLLMAALTALTVLSGINGVINSISAVVPFLLASVVGISVFSIINTPPDLAPVAQAGYGLADNWLIAGVVYVSYNIILSIAVLGPLGARAKDKKTVLKGAVLGGLGLGLGVVMIYLAILGNMAAIKDLEIPMSHIAGNISRNTQIIYAVILIAEVYTTAVASLYGFSARLSNAEKSPRASRALVTGTAAAAFFASLAGFSNLIKYLYPIVGYAGLLLLGCLLYSKLKSRRSA
ncbi:MAG: hypothetical protein FWE85_00110 [Clostridiales bacterium]|nr:hypothetical protein [Clostridiales bacterium]